MTATYTVDVFSTLDGFGSHDGDWGGYWGKQGPELLEHRAAIYRVPARMVFGATMYRTHSAIIAQARRGPSRTTNGSPG